MSKENDREIKEKTEIIGYRIEGLIRTIKERKNTIEQLKSQIFLQESALQGDQYELEILTQWRNEYGLKKSD